MRAEFLGLGDFLHAHADKPPEIRKNLIAIHG
jgi:hypothetical protein